MARRTHSDSDFRGRIRDLKQDFQELTERILSLPREKQAEHVKLTMDRCSDALKKSLQALPPEQ